MASKTEERRAALKEKLVVLAKAKIAAGGIGSLKARELAKDAGCALGAIYTVFDDLTALILAVNARSFEMLRTTVTAAVAQAGTQSPDQRLITMSLAYLQFAQSQPYLWRALFEVDLDDGPAPDWYRAELGGLMALITEPMAEIFPELSAKETALTARAMFSSVHGIVLLGLDRATSGVPHDQIGAMITLVLTRVVRNA